LLLAQPRAIVIGMIHHVQLACPPGTEDVLRAFYRDVLGLVEKPKPPALAARGGCWFASPEGLSEPRDIEIHLGVERDFRPARKAHPGLLWPALDELAGRLSAAGYPVEWSDELPGYRRFYTADPHGNRLEFLAVAVS
jgi:catechol 2,3-dioxygenase-like lactoylglutathione lyase family enzyme